MFIQPVSTVSFTTLLHIIAELFTTIYIDKKALFFNQNEENKITGKVSTRLQFFGSFPWLSIIPIISHIPVFFMDMNFFTRTPNIDQNILGSFRNASGTTFLNLGSLGVTPYSLAMLLFETYLKINFFVRILYTQFGELSSSRSTNFIIKLTGAISMMSAGYINVALIEPTCLNYDACLVANNIFWLTMGAVTYCWVCGCLDQIGMGEGVSLLFIVSLIVTNGDNVEAFMGIVNTLDVRSSIFSLLFITVVAYGQQGIYFPTKIRSFTKPGFISYNNLILEFFSLRLGSHSIRSVLGLGHTIYGWTLGILWSNTYVSSIIAFITIVLANLITVKLSSKPKELAEKITKLGFLLIDYRPGQETTKYLSIKFKVFALANGILTGIIFILLDKLNQLPILDIYTRCLVFLSGINTILTVVEARPRINR